MRGPPPVSLRSTAPFCGRRPFPRVGAGFPGEAGIPPAVYQNPCRRGSSVTLDSYHFFPCSISSAIDPDKGVPGANSRNNYQPTPYTEGGEAWQRAMSIISGSCESANYTVGNYWDILKAIGG